MWMTKKSLFSKTGHKGGGWPSKMSKNGPHGLCMAPYLIEPTKQGPRQDFEFWGLKKLSGILSRKSMGVR